MNSHFRTLAETQTSSIPDASHAVVVLNTWFDCDETQRVFAPGAAVLSEASARLVADCARVLKHDGLLFVYGRPQELALWGEHLAGLRGDDWLMVFKYWFALDIDDSPRGETLAPSHVGLLLFGKARPGRRGPRFQLNLRTDAVRTPHLNCAACGKTLKDWGGKKHLMNPKGAALSDVWRDLPRRKLREPLIPGDVLARVAAMSLGDGRTGLHVIQDCTGRARHSARATGLSTETERRARSDSPCPHIEPDTVHQGDCVSFLNRVAELHPDGLFDLAFADPPYNLAKAYGEYADELADQNYLHWCNEWLAGMTRALKPGGSLFVLNLPKWAIHHAAFLNGLLEFRHWIVWDALSDPRGKIMPAHYALLWFTKPGGKRVCNYGRTGKPLTPALSPSDAEREMNSLVLAPDSPKYCLRAACVRERKARGEDEKSELTDVWFDIHRIKHKRDRDAHPCQLPDKLMERIIKLTTNPGGVVFDPFCGAGTTAIAAAKIGRRYVVTDLDPDYVRITRQKLASMKAHADLFGNFTVPRASVSKKKAPASKREIETYLQALAQKLGRVPNEGDVETNCPAMLSKIDLIYPNRRAALKRAKLVLDN